MNDSNESLAAQFWTTVEEQLQTAGYSPAESRSMMSGYRARIADVGNIDLVYHQGVEETVNAIIRRGYVTDPKAALQHVLELS